jgi:hypothetical protein
VQTINIVQKTSSSSESFHGKERSSDQSSLLIIEDSSIKYLPELWHSQNHTALADGCGDSPITQYHTPGQLSQTTANANW